MHVACDGALGNRSEENRKTLSTRTRYAFPEIALILELRDRDAHVVYELKSGNEVLTNATSVRNTDRTVALVDRSTRYIYSL